MQQQEWILESFITLRKQSRTKDFVLREPFCMEFKRGKTWVTKNQISGCLGLEARERDELQTS